MSCVRSAAMTSDGDERMLDVMTHQKHPKIQGEWGSMDVK